MSQYFPKPYEPFGGDINVNFATKPALTYLSNTVPDITTLILKSETMTQKLQKLKANMLVILDLTQNQHKQMLLQKEILMQKSLSSEII